LRLRKKNPLLKREFLIFPSAKSRATNNKQRIREEMEEKMGGRATLMNLKKDMCSDFLGLRGKERRGRMKIKKRKGGTRIFPPGITALPQRTA